MKLTLPLPAKELSPNKRVHWAIRARAVKAARDHASMLVRMAGGKHLPRFTRYTLAFYLPDARRRDDDNLCASCKSYRDGIADGLGVDDHTLKRTGEVGIHIDRANPRLEITLINDEMTRRQK